MVYLTPDIYVIKRMRKLIDEAMDKNTAIKEFDLIEIIAKEMSISLSSCRRNDYVGNNECNFKNRKQFFFIVCQYIFAYIINGCFSLQSTRKI